MLVWSAGIVETSLPTFNLLVPPLDLSFFSRCIPSSLSRPLLRLSLSSYLPAYPLLFGRAVSNFRSDLNRVLALTRPSLSSICPAVPFAPVSFIFEKTRLYGITHPPQWIVIPLYIVDIGRPLSTDRPNLNFLLPQIWSYRWFLSGFSDARDPRSWAALHINHLGEPETLYQTPFHQDLRISDLVKAPTFARAYRRPRSRPFAAFFV